MAVRFFKSSSLWQRRNEKNRISGAAMAKILIVDDEEKMRHLLSLMLERRGHKVDQAGDGLVALDKLPNATYDMVISDIKMPRMDGIQLLQQMKGKKISCPMVFITAFATVESAVDAMRQGAVDYITKPFEEDRILLTIERTLRVSQLISENRDLKRELQKAVGEEPIIYVSEKMANVMDLAEKVAQTDSAVLVTGESGTGKELLSKYIHRKSTRMDERFVPVNCAAISPNLVESELFGHERGAFTGADRRKIGKFEYASGGTLFLDEIGDLPLEAQAKLLRAIQENKIQRVGGNEELPIDVRLICATNRNLNDLVAKGNFRQDLFFRINVFPIHTPALSERLEDVAPLANHFLHRVRGGSHLRLTEGAVKSLKAYRWPGNVRELANAIERSAILEGSSGVITAETLSFLQSGSLNCEKNTEFELSSDGLSLENLEKSLVRQALELSGNNQSQAAKLLGLSRAKFRVLMKQAKY
jgi:DNA-binding NtrC family response regulator